MQIVTDSSCDLPRQWIDDWKIMVIPLQIEIDGKTYVDGIDLSHEAFYRKMAAATALPRTSQPSPKHFEQVYGQALEKDPEVLSIHLSSRLSGTYAGAVSAREEMRGNITVMDSLNGSLGLGFQVLKACELVREGWDKATVLNKLKEYRDQMRVVVFLETLENAVKGGRVSRPKELVASMLNLKSLVHVEDGYVRILKTVRGKKKALRGLMEEMEKKAVDYRDRVVGIAHCDCQEEAEKLREEVERNFQPKDIVVTTMGPVIGTHAGQGGLLLCF